VLAPCPPARLKHAVKKVDAQAGRCMQAAVVRGRRGVVHLMWRTQPGGSVTHVGVERSTIGDDCAVACVVKAARLWRLNIDTPQTCLGEYRFFLADP
jgi:hypothetical protein